MLRAMATDFFARSPVLLFPVLALGIFFVVFVAIAVRALRTDRDQLDAAARIPLNDGDDSHE